MTVVMVKRPQNQAAKPAVRDIGAEIAFDALLRHVAGNRFLPVPPAGAHSVGDGDFRAIGAEFLGHFVRQGGLKPDESVLDIGCGLGRMAIPLTQYLREPAGRYHGIDIVASAIEWCQRAITPFYGQFTFEHLDVRSALYNPKGSATPEAVPLPVGSANFDFVIMTSVLTHMHAAEAAAYLREAGRVLRPGGRCFVSLFVMEEAAKAALRAKRSRLGFDPAAAGPEFHADPDHPLAAVAYDRDHFLAMAAAAGLAPLKPIVAGTWSGRQGLTYQDLCVLGPAGEASSARGARQ
ncbi:MAG: class I SAM-dependent methyltransferase [Alphaproteobacteria bacterium]|nr:class I SAM-dependent methyltransferase [Alphaproteobacteria bacterium]